MKKRVNRSSKKKRILTYGTFDLLHIGHINLLRRARSMGGHLTVGLSTDGFNLQKHKESMLPFSQRRAILESIRFVDRVIPENTWEQKARDITKHDIDILVMGEDWKGKFDHLTSYCKVVYLPRTKRISTTALKKTISGSL